MADLQSQDPTWKVEKPLTETNVGGAPGYETTATFDWEDGHPGEDHVLLHLLPETSSTSWCCRRRPRTGTKDQAVFDAFLASFKTGPDCQ